MKKKTYKGWMIVHGPRRSSLGVIIRSRKYPYHIVGITGYVYVYPTKSCAYADIAELTKSKIYDEDETFDVVKVEVNEQ